MITLRPGVTVSITMKGEVRVTEPGKEEILYPPDSREAKDYLRAWNLQREEKWREFAKREIE